MVALRGKMVYSECRDNAIMMFMAMADHMKNLLFLDTEATGLDEEDRLVQVAYSFNGQECEQMFNPGHKMTVRSMEVTHITDRMLADKEVFRDSAFYTALQDILAQDDVIFVAHNAPFDIGMLTREGLAVGQFIDTIKIAQELDVKGIIPAYRLQYLRYYLDMQVDDASAHDALGDVRVLVALFERQYTKMRETRSHEEVLAKMVDISSKPVMVKRFAFGKYNGEMVADVARTDRGYLEWLLGQKEQTVHEGGGDDNDANWIYTLKKYLSN